MTVILQPISPVATGATTTPEYTTDGCRIERPQVPSHENCAIVTKRQQVQTMKGELAAVEWIFRNENGDPVDLTIITGVVADESSESSVSATIEETYTVNARFTDCDHTGDILEVVGSIIAATTGVVRFKVPPQFACQSGIYRMQVALVKDVTDDDGIPVLINTALWSVEEGLWGDVTKRSGIPSFSEIRIHMRDTNVENDLLADVEFDDEEIIHALVRPIDQWNETPPPVAQFTCRTFPFRYHWLNAVVGELLKTAAHHYMRNNLKMNHAGLQGNFKDKANEYLAVAQMYHNEWTEFITTKKVSINAEMAYGSMGSPYGRGG